MTIKLEFYKEETTIKTNIFIPKKIKVGFQNRSDTYTKKLAYIIYFDEKGKLRKETSWNSWRDNEIEAVEFDNVPTSGFVLNKKAGGYDTGWNHRQTYVRVYDSRDFEFEITIPNLLYILENTSSIKGKGLEGEFVYGWDGKDLLLIPTTSPDYVEINKFNEIIHKKEHIKAKDLKIGGIYKTKKNEDYIYMGRFDYHDYKYEYNYDALGGYRGYKYVPVNKGKHYFFTKHNLKDGYDRGFWAVKSLGNQFVEVVCGDCVDDYADLFDKLECSTDYSPYDESKDEVIHYTLDELEVRFKDWSRYWLYIHHYALDNNEKIITKTELNYNSDTNEYFYYKPSYNYYRTHDDNKVIIGNLKDVFEKYKPTYKNQYLQNNKFYRRLP